MMKKETIRLVRCGEWRRAFFLLLFGVALCASTAFAEMRIWEEKSGKQFAAEYVRNLEGHVTLRTVDKTPLFINVEDLSDRDVKYIQTLIPPEIEIDTRKKEKAKERNEDFVKGGDIITVVTIEVQVKKTNRNPYAGKLKAEVYLIGKEVATDDYVLFGKGTSPVEFTEENRGLCEFSISADIRHFQDYDRQQRGATYEGNLVVVLDSNGNRLDAKTRLSWLEDDKIDALRALRLGSFFDKKCRKRSVPRPKYFDDRMDF